MSGEGLGNAALIALLAIVPLVVLMLTSFVKLSIVLALSRNAIGATDAPSGLVVMGIALVLTFFVMAPVGVDMIRAATGNAAPAPTDPKQGPVNPYDPTAPKQVVDPKRPVDPYAPDAPKQVLNLDAAVRQLVPAQYAKDVDAAARALVPLKGFLAKHADARDKETFVGVAGRMGRAANGDELWVLAPAFLATELREAFAIAVLIFVPFLVIDLVVGLGLAALGLATTQPQTVALPLKLLLFVAVDGWRLLLESLLRGYV